MADTYINLNKCRSFNVTLPGGTAKTPLADQVCSEVIIINRTTGDVTLYDGGYDAAENGLLLKAEESMTLRGITNTNQVSAVGSGPLYYRTQYYSNSPSR